jgi:hypothetical protein
MERIQYILVFLLFLGMGVCGVFSSIHTLRFYDEWRKSRGGPEIPFRPSVVANFYRRDIPESCVVHRKKWLKSVMCMVVIILATIMLIAIPKLIAAIL